MRPLALAVAFLLGVSAGCCRPRLNVAREARAIAPMVYVGLPYCTAWHVGQGLWITARHCAVEGAYVLGEPLRLLGVGDGDVDAAVYSGPNPGTSVELGEDGAFGQPVHVVGYPQFQGVPHHATLEGFLGDSWGPYVEFFVMIDGGASGSPLLDERGAAVGLVVRSVRGRPYALAIRISSVTGLLRTLGLRPQS